MKTRGWFLAFVCAAVALSGPGRAIADPLRPYAALMKFSITHGQELNLVSQTLPANTILVLESVTGTIDLPSGQRLAGVGLFSNLVVEGQTVSVELYPSIPAALGSDIYQFGSALPAYLQGVLTVSVRRVQNTGHASITIQVFGHLVPAAP